MSINKYQFDVAFVRGVTELTNEQVRALESIGLEYDPYKFGGAAHLQVWCGCLRGFAVVPDYCVQDALRYGCEDDQPKLFFGTVEDLVAALS